MVEVNKSLYRGLFSYNCELKELYAYAYTKNQAKTVMIKRLAKVHDINPAIVFKLFDGNKENFEITIEMEVEEGE